MCVRAAKAVSPKQKKVLMTNKLYGGVGAELLSETKGMDVIDELVFLNKELRRLQDLCAEYRKEINLHEDRFSDYREFLYLLRIKAKNMDWSPTTDELIRSIECELEAEERNC